MAQLDDEILEEEAMLGAKFCADHLRDSSTMEWN